jgi:hypothetical protein
MIGNNKKKKKKKKKNRLSTVRGINEIDKSKSIDQRTVL